MPKKTDDQFKGLGLSKDLRDFYYHCSLSSKPPEFFRQFDEEFQDFVKRKMQGTIENLQRRIQ